MTTDDRTTLTARTPEDLLALVPLLFGFIPELSVCMLAFGPRSFHARVDLPDTQHDIGLVVDQLLEPVLRHGSNPVVFVVFGPDTPITRTLGRRLVAAFRRDGVVVPVVLRTHEGEWSALEGRRWGTGLPYDVSTHPFRAEGVFQGRVTHASRAALAASIDAVPELVDAVRDHLGDPPGALSPDQRLAELVWAAATVVRAVETGEALDPRELARLLRALVDPAVRDEVCEPIRRVDACDHVRFWSTVVRAAPPGLVAAPAAILGFAAWMDGDGALAWCALDRCVGDDPDYRLAELLGILLMNAVPPPERADDSSDWWGLDDSS
jgi:hypothetical protein